jgi:hypothetical protein
MWLNINPEFGAMGTDELSSSYVSYEIIVEAMMLRPLKPQMLMVKTPRLAECT